MDHHAATARAAGALNHMAAEIERHVTRRDGQAIAFTEEVAVERRVLRDHVSATDVRGRSGRCEQQRGGDRQHQSSRRVRAKKALHGASPPFGPFESGPDDTARRELLFLRTWNTASWLYT